MSAGVHSVHQCREVSCSTSPRIYLLSFKYTDLGSAPNLPAIVSPETSLSASVATPSPNHPPASALLSLSPPPTMARKSSSHSDLQRSDSGRRPKVIRRMSMESAGGSSEERLEDRYEETEDDDEAAGILSALSINVSPGRRKTGLEKVGKQRGGRHSVGSGDVSGAPLTLRDQEQVSRFERVRQYADYHCSNSTQPRRISSTSSSRITF